MKKLLLIFVILVWAVPAAAGPCDIPIGYANVVVVEEADMLISFATDKDIYGPYETALFYLVVENIGTETFYMNWNIDPQDGVFVLPDSCTSVNQTGCYAAAAFYHPTILYYYSAGTTLEPGECRIWTRTWDIGTWGGGPPPVGNYRVLGGMFEADPVTPPGNFVLPAGGATLSIAIDYAIPTNASTWGQVKSMYR